MIMSVMTRTNNGGYEDTASIDDDIDDEIVITSNKIDNYNEAMGRVYRLVLAPNAVTILTAWRTTN